MQRFSLNLATAAFVLFIFSISSLSAQDNLKTDWDAYSKDLVKSIKSTNEGVQLSAMQRIIQHNDSIHVTNARYDVMDIFLKNKSQKVRQLALVTLSKINNSLDMGQLERHFEFEEDPIIKMHISFILLEKGRITYDDFRGKYQVALSSK